MGMYEGNARFVCVSACVCLCACPRVFFPNVLVHFFCFCFNIAFLHTLARLTRIVDCIQCSFFLKRRG